MPSHYFYNSRKHFIRPAQTAPRGEAEITAREMIRIFGRDAESMAVSQTRKFADRRDEEAAQVWRNIGTAIGKARVQPR